MILFYRKNTWSDFKTFNQVQGQGGPRDSSAGIYLIFRVLNPSVQHRNWAWGEVLKPLLTFLYAKYILNQIVSIHEDFFVSKP